MPDQADHLRELVRQAIDARPTLGPGLPIVVLSGGMAGVGTTTVAIQLARELARLGKAAVLVDANLAHPQLAQRLGVAAHGSVTDVLSGSRSAVEILEQVGESVYLLPAGGLHDTPPDLSRVAVNRLLSELHGLHTHSEVAIIDAGHGMSPWVQRWWRSAQQVFLVTTGAEAAVKKSYVALKHAPWGDADGKVRLVVNRCDDRAAAEGIAERFARTSRRFLGLHVGGAPAIACQSEQFTSDSTTQDAFHQSVRLLATEIVTANLVVNGCIPRRGANRNQRIAELLALPDFSLNSTNNSHSTAQE